MSAFPFRFSLVLGQRLPWPILQANALATETFGFDGLYLVDHFLGRLDINEPTHEGYTMLAAVASNTNRVRLGLMVAGNTYRNPVLLLKQAIAVDHISRGRVDFGVGAGWSEREHEAYSFDFPGAGERVDRFAEALAIWRDLQSKPRTTFAGTHYDIVDTPFEPKSVQGKLPVLIGGTRPRMLRLVAEYADIWNATAEPDEAARLSQLLSENCNAIGRDPATIERSVSPAFNLLASPDAFRTGVERYHQDGFTHITLPWPRVDAEVAVLQEVAALYLQEYRPNPQAPDPYEESGDIASTESGLRAYGYPPRANQFVETRWIAIADHPERRLVAYLADRPGQVVTADEMVSAFEFENHRQVSLAFAHLGDRFDTLGADRPWMEGPRGWMLDDETAASFLGA